MTGAPHRWPFEGDRPIDRARRIANSLLAYLDDADREHIVEQAHRYGEAWLGGSLVVYDDDQAITGDLAAEMLAVPEHEVRRWATMPHPDDPTRPLLPRAGLAGRRQTYVVAHLLEARDALRRHRQLQQLIAPS